MIDEQFYPIIAGDVREVNCDDKGRIVRIVLADTGLDTVEIRFEYPELELFDLAGGAFVYPKPSRPKVTIGRVI